MNKIKNCMICGDRFLTSDRGITCRKKKCAKIYRRIYMYFNSKYSYKKRKQIEELKKKIKKNVIKNRLINLIIDEIFKEKK